MKTCIKCNIIKDISFFGKDKNRKDYLTVYCKECFSIIKKCINKKYSKSLKGKNARMKAKKKYISRPEIRFRANQLRRLRSKQEQRQKSLRRTFDPLYKLTCSLRTRLNHFLRTNKLQKTCKFNDYIGCSKMELFEHLEKQFKEKMTWNNHGEWHIDHIIPLASGKTEQEIYKLCHYSNLQPLWKDEHYRKTTMDFILFEGYR